MRWEARKLTTDSLDPLQRILNHYPVLFFFKTCPSRRPARSADNLCLQAATRGGIRPDRPWRAILSSGSVHAKDRIVQNGPTFNPQMSMIAEKGALFGSTLKKAISLTEDGTPLNDSVRWIWGGCDANGITGLEGSM